MSLASNSSAINSEIVDSKFINLALKERNEDLWKRKLFIKVDPLARFGVLVSKLI